MHLIKIILIIGFIMLISCVATNNTTLVKYPSNRHTDYTMQVPKGYIFQGKMGDHHVENVYLYPDSSLIFITDFSNSPNYDVLVKDSLYYTKFAANVLSNDTLFLEGVFIERYWKDITYGPICIGYHNVQESKKSAYDTSLKSFRMR